jgi:hypothetical protein
MPPHNARFAYVAYAVATAVYAVYAASIWWRARNVARQLRTRPEAERQPDAS